MSFDRLNRLGQDVCSNLDAILDSNSLRAYLDYSANDLQAAVSTGSITRGQAFAVAIYNIFQNIAEVNTVNIPAKLINIKPYYDTFLKVNGKFTVTVGCDVSASVAKIISDELNYEKTQQSQSGKREAEGIFDFIDQPLFWFGSTPGTIISKFVKGKIDSSYANNYLDSKRQKFTTSYVEYQYGEEINRIKERIDNISNVELGSEGVGEYLDTIETGLHKVINELKSKGEPYCVRVCEQLVSSLKTKMSKVYEKFGYIIAAKNIIKQYDELNIQEPDYQDAVKILELKINGALENNSFLPPDLTEELRAKLDSIQNLCDSSSGSDVGDVNSQQSSDADNSSECGGEKVNSQLSEYIKLLVSDYDIAIKAIMHRLPVAGSVHEMSELLHTIYEIENGLKEMDAYLFSNDSVQQEIKQDDTVERAVHAWKSKCNDMNEELSMVKSLVTSKLKLDLRIEQLCKYLSGIEKDLQLGNDVDFIPQLLEAKALLDLIKEEFNQVSAENKYYLMKHDVEYTSYVNNFAKLTDRYESLYCQLSSQYESRDHDIVGKKSLRDLKVELATVMDSICAGTRMLAKIDEQLAESNEMAESADEIKIAKLRAETLEEIKSAKQDEIENYVSQALSLKMQIIKLEKLINDSLDKRGQVNSEQSQERKTVCSSENRFYACCLEASPEKQEIIKKPSTCIPVICSNH